MVFYNETEEKVDEGFTFDMDLIKKILNMILEFLKSIGLDLPVTL